MRRFGPLLALLAFALATVLVRLWDVQVTEHDVWAAESVNLVRSHAVEPYVRGAIKDRQGRVLAHDEKVYALEFVWRDFRRGHPLGQVAMMRSLAQMRPVGLDEARVGLGRAAMGYANLSPADLERFALGEALDTGIDYVPAIAAVDEEQRLERATEQRRRARAGDLRFYVLRLLELTTKEQRALRDLLDEEDGAAARSFLDLAGQVTRRTTEEVAVNLRTKVEQAELQLSRLALLIEMTDGDLEGLGVDPTAAAIDRLVALVEARRREVEDDAADELFRIASGFAPGRLSPANLDRFELDWLAAALDWDGTRLDQWRRRRGAVLHHDAAEWIAGHTIARAKIGGARPADRVLSALAHAFRVDPDAWSRGHEAPQDWRQVDELEVLATLPERLVGGAAAAERCAAPTLPFQFPRAETLPLEGPELLEALLGAELAASSGALVAEAMGAEDLDEARRLAALLVPAHLVEIAQRRRSEWRVEEARWVAGLLRLLDERLQARVAEVLDVVELEEGNVRFRGPYVEKAQETRRYVVRDRGARAKQVGREPHIDLVLLVTRYPDAFAGFRVTRLTRRVADRTGPDGETPLAFGLVGRVRSPVLMDILRQRPGLEELARLQRKLRLPEADEERILELIDQSFHPGQSVGGSGLEAWFNAELSGTSGVVEIQGLQDRVEGNRDPIYRGAEDGEDVVLTLDADLQLAAEEVLSSPEVPLHDKDRDDVWFERPVGALVLATVDGEILAAASVPMQPDLRDDAISWTLDGQQRVAIERTLRRPVAQPPGSVVKPLLAAWALENLGLDPDAPLFFCDSDRPRLGVDPKDSKWAGWGSINCNVSRGHSPGLGDRALTMREALVCSCNVYFAGLGETRYDGPSMRAAYGAFGFGRGTGVRWDAEAGRHGIYEEALLNPGGPMQSADPEAPGPRDRQALGNGLSHVDANVVQVVRAYAGLATGHLPEMTLVRRVGEREVPRRVQALDISDDHLDRVRDALHGVVHERRGTAFKANLREEMLGFSFSAKTGTADLPDGYGLTEEVRASVNAKDLKSRKHAWLAGWFPSDEPRYVLVVYCHNTSAGAGHTAAHVAHQFLTRPEIRSLMGVD